MLYHLIYHIKCIDALPILAQCSISIPPDKSENFGFLTFSGGIKMEH